MCWESWDEIVVYGESMSDLIERWEVIELLSDRRCNTNCFDESGQKVYEELSKAIESIKALPSAQPKLPENWWKTDHGYMWLCPHCGLPVHSDFEECLRCGTKRQSAQPELNEWCHDCKEYDKEHHCCPRWNRVIRTTLEEAQPDKTYEQGWKDGREALRKEIWEDERDRLN